MRRVSGGSSSPEPTSRPLAATRSSSMAPTSAWSPFSRYLTPRVHPPDGDYRNVSSDEGVVGSACEPNSVMNDDQARFEQLVRTLGRPAMKFANVLVHDMDLAEEIVQEAFARAWASPNTPSPEVEFRRYLYRIVANLAHDHYRRQSR